jgi:hypothetical protein
VVALVCFDVLYVFEGVEHCKEGPGLEVVAAGDDDNLDLFLLLIGRILAG